MSSFKKITDHLDKNKAKYEVLEHEPVVTSDDAVRVTGEPPQTGAKALVLKTDEHYVLCVVKGSNRLSYKKVRDHLGVRKLRFANPGEVVDVMGVEIGACYPMGIIADIPMVVDETLAENDYITFSPATHDKHIKMSWDEYNRVVGPELVDLAE